MKIVIGLGNPGVKYANTRHNVGFWVVDRLAEEFGIQVSREKWSSLVGEGIAEGQKFLLCKPQTFMNLSGRAIREITTFFRDVNPETDLMVVYDDLDLPVGQIRLRLKGSAGGHNGMKSAIEHLGTGVFPRIRVGIGRPRQKDDVIPHVLSPFSADERDAMEKAVQRAADAVRFALDQPFTLAMNRFNGTEHEDQTSS